MQVVSNTDIDGPERLLSIEAYDDSYIAWLFDISRQVNNSKQNILKHETDLIKKRRRMQRRLNKIEKDMRARGWLDH